MDKFLRSRIDEVALWARQHGYPDVCSWMLAKEKREAHAPTSRKRKTVLYTERGEKIELYRDVVKKLEE